LPWKDEEAQHTWALLETNGVARHVRLCRRWGILVTHEHVMEELLELREGFGPERCEGLA
jgi:hypothetical protein